MKLRFSIIVLAISVLLLFNSPAISRENPYPRLTRLMYDFFKAMNEVQFSTLDSAHLFAVSFTDEPDPEKIKASAQSLKDKSIRFKNSSQKIRKFIDENENKLKDAKETVRKIKADSSYVTVSQIEGLADSFKAYADGISENEFTVYSNEGWTNSGITVDQDDLIYVEANGSWTVSPNYENVGWQGYLNKSNKAYKINEGAPLGTLLYRVRGSSKSDGFYLDDSKRGAVDTSGRLEFVINDTQRANNLGQLNLKVIVFNGKALKNLVQTMENLKGKNN
jgi:hypothetical protein